MAKVVKVKKAKEPEKIIQVHSSLCGDCFYNEEGECSKNPEKCRYNFPPKIEEYEEDLIEEN